MKKIIVYLLIAVCIFSIACPRVHAADDTNNTIVFEIDGGNGGTGCEDVLGAGSGEDAVDLMRDILGYIRILAPIALIIFTAADFAVAVLAQDNDAMKKASSKVVKRCIMALAIFLVPTLIRAILDLPGVRGALSTVPSDPFCGAVEGS